MDFAAGSPGTLESPEKKPGYEKFPAAVAAGKGKTDLT
jgi:hypothetical protein